MARGAAMDINATHIVAAWDHDGPTFRHALFPTYKHRRTGSMRSRVAPIREGVEATESSASAWRTTKEMTASHR
jgi:5'-3' exonuclease